MNDVSVFEFHCTFTSLAALGLHSCNVGVPFALDLDAVSTMHRMSVSLELDRDGRGTVWGRQLAASMFADAGSGDVQVRGFESDRSTTRSAEVGQSVHPDVPTAYGCNEDGNATRRQ